MMQSMVLVSVRKLGVDEARQKWGSVMRVGSEQRLMGLGG